MDRGNGILSSSISCCKNKGGRSRSSTINLKAIGFMSHVTSHVALEEKHRSLLLRKIGAIQETLLHLTQTCGIDSTVFFVSFFVFLLFAFILSYLRILIALPLKQRYIPRILVEFLNYKGEKKHTHT